VGVAVGGLDEREGGRIGMAGMEAGGSEAIEATVARVLRLLWA